MRTIVRTTRRITPRAWTRRVGCWLALTIVACSGARESTSTPPAPTPVEREQLVVFAAASLRDAFGSVGERMRATHPTLELTFNFAGSQELRAQIEHGAPADVFASADTKHMAALQAAGHVAEPSVFTRNAPVIVVNELYAPKVHGLADLPSLERLVLGAADVPIGRYSRQILDNAAPALGADFPKRVLARVVSNELNVKQVLAKVTLGEADAGIVYQSDVPRADARVRAVAIPAELNVIADYPIAIVRGAKHALLAAEFVGLVRGDVGRAALSSAGFLPAPAPSAGLP